MAVAAPTVAVRVLAANLLFALTVSAAAQGTPSPCRPPLPSLPSDKGQDFIAGAYGRAMWHAKSATGRHLPYALHVWKGKADGTPAYLTFDEIPGTSGPNYHLDTTLKRSPAKIDWRAKRDFVFDPRVIIRSGPLAGEWTVTNCEMR